LIEALVRLADSCYLYEILHHVRLGAIRQVHAHIRILCACGSSAFLLASSTFWDLVLCLFAQESPDLRLCNSYVFMATIFLNATSVHWCKSCLGLDPSSGFLSILLMQSIVSSTTANVFIEFGVTKCM